MLGGEEIENMLDRERERKRNSREKERGERDI